MFELITQTLTDEQGFIVYGHIKRSKLNVTLT